MPASSLGASQRQELEALATEIGFRFVLVGDRLTILDGHAPIFQSFSISAAFGFLRGYKHALRVSEVTASVGAGEPASEAPAGGAR